VCHLTVGACVLPSGAYFASCCYIVLAYGVYVGYILSVLTHKLLAIANWVNCLEAGSFAPSSGFAFSHLLAIGLKQAA
jgi:hypothetical protein